MNQVNDLFVDLSLCRFPTLGSNLLHMRVVLTNCRRILTRTGNLMNCALGELLIKAFVEITADRKRENVCSNSGTK